MRNWTYDVIGGRPLPNCPYSSSSIPPNEGEMDKPIYHNPTISTTHYIFVLSFLIFMILTLIKYGSVKIFNRIILHPSVSNRFSASLFGLLAVASLIDGLRYTLDFPHQAILSGSIKIQSGDDDPERYIVGPEIIDSWLLLGSTIVRSLALFMLTLSLNHQKNYRSVQIPSAPLSHSVLIPSAVSDSESAPLLVNSPTFDATPVIPAPVVELDDEPAQDDITDLDGHLPTEQFVLSRKLTSTWRYFGRVYDFLCSSGWMLPIVAFSTFVIRISTLISLADPARLSDFNGTVSNGVDLFSVSILGSILQLAPTLFVSFSITIPASSSNSPTSTVDLGRSNNEGPTLFSKLVLISSLVLTMPFWIEPSIICRIITDYILMNTRNEALCVVPPWWWQKVKGYALAIIPAHGWASYIDFVIWMAGLGVFGLFSFMKLEYNRNADQWIAATVSEVQSTFGFY